MMLFNHRHLNTFIEICWMGLANLFYWPNG